MSKFSKVSYEQWSKCCPDYIDAHAALDNLSLPTRATSGSAGYDFYCPYDISLDEYVPVMIPTGIRCEIDNGYFLAVVPRSSLGFKYGVKLMNTVGIIDEDYFHADNEGHIMLKMKSDRRVDLKAGDRIAQGILIPYGVAQNGNMNADRTGGMGSTGK